jgi:hypothetical protein
MGNDKTKTERDQAAAKNLAAVSGAAATIGGAMAGAPPVPPKIDGEGLSGSAGISPSMFSSGEGAEPMSQSRQVGRQYLTPLRESKGGVIPGKAKVPGDSTENDTVPAIVSPGEVVVPRTIVEAGHKASAEFVKKALQVHKKQESGGFESVVEAQQALDKAIQDINKKYGKKG